MVTIVDVAREAKVSTATVSRVLNNNLSVSDEKIERVKNAIEKLGYRVSTNAENAKEAKYIALVSCVNISELIDGVAEETERRGYHLLTILKPDAARNIKSIMEEILDIGDKLAGMLLLNIKHDEEDIQQLKKHFPVVVVGEHTCCGTYVVSTDNQKACRDVVSYFVKKGRKQIAFLTLGQRGGVETQLSLERRAGYIQGILENGMEYNPDLTASGDFSCEGGYEAARKLVRTGVEFDAVCCISDKMAAGCIKALREAGRKIPEDVAVCGFGNQEWTEWIEPAITTVDQDMRGMGKEAARILDAMIKGEEGRNSKVYIEHRLVERKTT